MPEKPVAANEILTHQGVRKAVEKVGRPRRPATRPNGSAIKLRAQLNQVQAR